MIDVGEPVPDIRVWSTPRDTLGLRELTDEGPYLLLFYLFDWSST